MPLSHLEPKIVYQDDDIFVLDKRPNCHSVINEKNANNSLAFWLKTYFPAQEKIGKSENDCGLIQRLDYETRGLLIAARNQKCWDKLFTDLQQGKIEKYYYCLMKGKLEQKKMEIKGFIGSPYRSATKMKFYKDKPAESERALPSETVFELKKYYPEKDFSLAKAFANTARRHQIRVHAKVLNHPLVGDKLYDPQLDDGYKTPLTFFLQASYLSFKHPVSGQPLSFTKDPDISEYI